MTSRLVAECLNQLCHRVRHDMHNIYGLRLCPFLIAHRLPRDPQYNWLPQVNMCLADGQQTQLLLILNPQISARV